MFPTMTPFHPHVCSWWHLLVARDQVCSAHALPRRHHDGCMSPKSGKIARSEVFWCGCTINGPTQPEPTQESAAIQTLGWVRVVNVALHTTRNVRGPNNHRLVHYIHRIHCMCACVHIQYIHTHTYIYIYIYIFEIHYLHYWNALVCKIVETGWPGRANSATKVG